ncbi:MAG: response regulator [Nitrospirae bacterium]|nr:response regulator [Nitrospirota bacterium]MBI3604593.1 response regulator [Nitrospirota bacterium]
MLSGQVLVVDDEEFFLKLMFHILRKDGCLVRTAQNREEALNWLRKETFDLAIVDIRMAPKDGFNVLEDIKKDYPRIKVIMTTGFPSPETRTFCLQSGAAGYIAKPIEIDELKGIIQSLLP